MVLPNLDARPVDITVRTPGGQQVSVHIDGARLIEIAVPEQEIANGVP
jgi:hypothetical protein